MGRWKQQLLSSLWLWLAATIWFAAPPTAAACSCAIPYGPMQEFASADVVFRGRTAGTAETNWGIRPLYAQWAKALSLPPPRLEQPIDFEVIAAWKGIETTHVTLYAEAGGHCAVRLGAGEYVVYGVREDGRGNLRLCARTRTVILAYDDLGFLRRQAELPLAPASPAITSRWPLAAAVLVLLVAAGWLWRHSPLVKRYETKQT